MTSATLSPARGPKNKTHLARLRPDHSQHKPQLFPLRWNGSRNETVRLLASVSPLIDTCQLYGLAKKYFIKIHRWMKKSLNLLIQLFPLSARLQLLMLVTAIKAEVFTSGNNFVNKSPKRKKHQIQSFYLLFGRQEQMLVWETGHIGLAQPTGSRMRTTQDTISKEVPFTRSHRTFVDKGCLADGNRAS